MLVCVSVPLFLMDGWFRTVLAAIAVVLAGLLLWRAAQAKAA